MSNIIDLAYLKATMGIPAGITFHDVALSYAIDAANGYVLGRLGQSSLAAITREEYPVVQDAGRRRVMLKRGPVVSIIAITHYSALVDPSDYRWDTDTDEIVLINDQSSRRLGYWDPTPDGVWVTYTYGYTSATLPAQVRSATASLANQIYLRTKHAGKTSERNSSYVLSLDVDSLVPPDTARVLAGLVDVHHD